MGGGPRAVRGAADRRRADLRPAAPGDPDHARQPGLLDREAGDKKTARDQYAALLPLEERLLGTDDPQTLATRGNLARFTGDAGDAAAARDQFAALLTDVERIFGPQHRETLTTRGSLAYWTARADPGTGPDVS